MTDTVTEEASHEDDESETTLAAEETEVAEDPVEAVDADPESEANSEEEKP